MLTEIYMPMGTESKYIIELSEQQLELVLGGIQCAINEGYSEDENIILLRYLRDRYNIDIFPYNDTKLSSEIKYEEINKEAWEPVIDLSNNKIIGYRRID